MNSPQAAAPIFRYGDPRLYGDSLVKPFARCYYGWVKPIQFPIHPDSYRIAEFAIRLFKAIIGLSGIVVTSPLALIGRIIQIVHYHCKSDKQRHQPDPVSVAGIALPSLDTSDGSVKGVKYHGTSREAAKGILRWNLDPSRTSLDSLMGNAAYISIAEEVSVSYGEDRLILSVDLDPREVAHLYNHEEWFETVKEQFLKKNSAIGLRKFFISVQELFLQNGYRAIKYNMPFFAGTTGALAVYDPSCISIQRITPSPQAAASLQLLAM